MSEPSRDSVDPVSLVSTARPRDCAVPGLSKSKGTSCPIVAHIGSSLGLVTCISAAVRLARANSDSLESGLRAQKQVLPFHAAAVAAIANTLRLLLVSRRFGAHAPYSPNGVEFAIFGSALFLSSALGAVATMVAPERLLQLLAFSALDVTAHWLNMVAWAKDPELPVALLFLFGTFAFADGHIACILAGFTRATALTWPAFCAKGCVNLYIAVRAARIVVQHDALIRSAIEHMPRHEIESSLKSD